MSNSVRAREKARHFLKCEKEFQLGFLPTEWPNEKTRHLDEVFAKETSLGVRMLQSVDRDICERIENVFESEEMRALVDSMYKAVSSGGRVVLSGCGSTGRLCLLLESMWRRFFRQLKKENTDAYSKLARYEEGVYSFMTGGDYALVRAVESFEDYAQFGREQAREAGIGNGDIMIAITEGGETSSVLGSAAESADKGAKVFLIFNNPESLLVDKLERCRQLICDPGVIAIDLCSGPMAISGSTRMQATTSEQLLVGAALEMTLAMLIEESHCRLSDIEHLGCADYIESFKCLLQSLESTEAVEAIAGYIEFEESIYRSNGLVTYYANEYMLDIFTDTTERSPTFKLPPFRKTDDNHSPVSWAFVKNPLYSTQQTWESALGRKVCCLTWKSEDYGRMDAGDRLVNSPPLIDAGEMAKFLVGNEEDDTRLVSGVNTAVMVAAGSETGAPDYCAFAQAFEKVAEKYAGKTCLVIGKSYQKGFFNIPCQPRATVLSLMEHLAVKLVLNTVSTGTMVRMGRVTGNWMTWVDVTNKKLLDRGVRIVAELCNLSYEDACIALHETLESFSALPSDRNKQVSPVEYTIQRINSSCFYTER
ncbi:MAG: sugar phosphate isomerase [bacterium]|nr:sugar phosphate isomerase [bacterium]